MGGGGAPVDAAALPPEADGDGPGESPLRRLTVDFSLDLHPSRTLNPTQAVRDELNSRLMRCVHTPPAVLCCAHTPSKQTVDVSAARRRALPNRLWVFSGDDVAVPEHGAPGRLTIAAPVRVHSAFPPDGSPRPRHACAGADSRVSSRIARSPRQPR
jgi:hypothetical protein